MKKANKNIITHTGCILSRVTAAVMEGDEAMVRLLPMNKESRPNPKWWNQLVAPHAGHHR